MIEPLRVRSIPFDFGSANAHWHPTQPEWGHMVNGGSLTMPYLEPFLNRTMRAAREHIEDPQLRQDVDGFVRQEAQHYRNHRRYNEMLKAAGYAELDAVEATFEADYEALEQRSLSWRLAYAAGFETMTIGITEWLIDDRDALFQGADPTVTSLVLWHMVEETEHKSVAFDVYQALVGRYWLRLAGLFWGSLHMGLMSRRAYRAMLKRDGRWSNLRSRLRLWRQVGRFLSKAGAAMVHAMRPGYHPEQRRDPTWVSAWQAAYEALPEGELPLLETHQGGIAPAFAPPQPS
ncbi:MAG: metal-dependent hydrolase [Pseudomonadota bacterium]